MLMVGVIGESHSDPLIGATVHDATSGAVLAGTQVVHIPALLPGDFLDASGRVGARIVIALAALRYIIYAEQQRADTIDPRVMEANVYSPSWSPAWRVNAGWKGVPLLFVTGELSARAVIASVPVYGDVDGAFAAAELERVPAFAAQASVSDESIRSVVAGQLAPMFGAVRLLRDLGIGPILLHSLSPTTTDDAQYRAETGRDTRARTRAKVVMLFNAAIRDFSRSEGLHFIDRWADVTDGGAARDGYLRDAVHLNNAVTRASLVEIYRRLVDEGADCVVRA